MNIENLEISSIEEVIFYLNHIKSLICFYEKYHDGCEFTTMDEIEAIPDDVCYLIEIIKLFLYEI